MKADPITIQMQSGSRLTFTGREAWTLRHLIDGGSAGVTTIDHPAPLSVARLEWEHIQRVLAENGNNISATARALNMHRRTLQRKLAKRPVRQ